MEVMIDDFGLEWKRKDGKVYKADYDDLIKAYEGQKEHDKEIRNKAIEEFAEKLKSFVDCGHLCSPTEPRWTDLSVCKMIDEIAEQITH